MLKQILEKEIKIEIDENIKEFIDKYKILFFELIGGVMEEQNGYYIMVSKIVLEDVLRQLLKDNNFKNYKIIKFKDAELNYNWLPKEALTVKIPSKTLKLYSSIYTEIEDLYYDDVNDNIHSRSITGLGFNNTGIYIGFYTYNYENYLDDLLDFIYDKFGIKLNYEEIDKNEAAKHFTYDKDSKSFVKLTIE